MLVKPPYDIIEIDKMIIELHDDWGIYDIDKTYIDYLNINNNQISFRILGSIEYCTNTGISFQDIVNMCNIFKIILQFNNGTTRIYTPLFIDWISVDYDEDRCEYYFMRNPNQISYIDGGGNLVVIINNIKEM